MMMNIRRISIFCNDVTLSVLTAGPVDGKMVLLLHGFPECAESWSEQINYLAGLGYFVVAPDQRGYNESSAPDSIQDYKLETLALDMVSLVKFFRKEKVFLVGHDWGAMVAWYLITFYPERFEKALIASAPHWSVFRKYLFTHPQQILKSWYIFFIQIPCLPELIFKFHSYFVLSSMIKKHNYPVDKLDMLKDSWIKFNKLKSMLNWYRAMRHLKVKLPHRKLQLPTLIVWGNDDPFCMSEMAEMSRRRCEKSEVIIMKGVGHWPQHQNKYEFNSILKSYFNS